MADMTDLQSGQPELDFVGPFVNNHIHDGCPGWADDWQAHWNVTDPVSLANLDAQRERGHWCARCIIKTPEFQADLAAAGLLDAAAA